MTSWCFYLAKEWPGLYNYRPVPEPTCSFSLPIWENKIISIFVKCLNVCKTVLLLFEFGIPQLANVHFFLPTFFFLFPPMLCFLDISRWILNLWDPFSSGAWLAPNFSSSSLPKQDRFLLHHFFVLCGICNTLPALYHLWIPFLLVVFSLSFQHLEWRSFLCCRCCNWTWYLKGGEKVGINCPDDSSPGLKDLLLWYQSLDQSSAMLSLSGET